MYRQDFTVKMMQSIIKNGLKIIKNHFQPNLWLLKQWCCEIAASKTLLVATN